MKYLLPLLLLVMLPLFSAPLFAAPDGQAPVYLEADRLSLDRDKQIYQASGNVHLLQDGTELFGEQIEWQRISNDLFLSGHVRLLSETDEMTGRRGWYNLASGQGWLEDARYQQFADHLHLQGERIERLDETRYHVERGCLTTCDEAVPDWKLGASVFDVTLGGYARGKNVFFYAKDVPFFYLPYLIYPAKTERQSGLLMPTIGYSGKTGFRYSGAYYQVLGIDQDATFYLDYLSQMGIGKGLEYRYIFPGNNAGEMLAYHIDVEQVDDVVVDEERYLFRWQHSGQLPGSVQLLIDAEYVNDNDYFNDFGDAVEEYNKDSVESLLSLTKSWQDLTLNGQARYLKKLDTSNEQTLQWLPRLSLTQGRKSVAGLPLYYSFESEYSNFWRDEGLDGERLVLEPTLSANLKLLRVFDMIPTLTWYERFYWGLSDDSASDHRGTFEFTNRLLTSLYRNYDLGLLSSGEGKLRHSLEPEIVYHYLPDHDTGETPVFDSVDRFGEINRLELALVQRLTARYDFADQASSYRDLVYLRLSQNYDLRSDLTASRWQSLRGELQFKPSDWLTLEADVTYDVDAGEREELSTSVALGPFHESSLRLGYDYDRDTDLDYASLDLSLGLLPPVYLTIQQRYDLFDKELPGQLYAIEYRRPCWSLRLDYQNRIDDGERDEKVMFTLFLRGLGEFGNGPASLGGL